MSVPRKNLIYHPLAGLSRIHYAKPGYAPEPISARARATCRRR